MNAVDSKVRDERKQIFKEVVGAFEQKYSWLGHQASRELLLSAASWNVQQYSDPPMRYRTHIMLAWRRGWLKSSILTKMAKVLGDDLCSVMGKVTDAGLRGSVSSGQFTPPKPLKTPIVISTEYGQTSFEDEILNMFLSMLEEGYTNITLNKLGQLPESQKRDIEKRFDGNISFGESNEFDLQTNFVFWGATYDPTKLQDDALRSRFNIVTPSEPLTGEVTEAIDKGHFQLSNGTMRRVREELKKEKPIETDFTPPSHFYDKHNLNPRESRDLQSYMAARHWWGLSVTPEIMENYINHLKKSRRRAKMSPEELVRDLIFDNPLTYEQISDETGYGDQHIYTILEQIDASPVPSQEGKKWAVWSGKSENEEKEKYAPTSDEGSELSDFLDDV